MGRVHVREKNCKNNGSEADLSPESTSRTSAQRTRFWYRKQVPPPTPNPGISLLHSSHLITINGDLNRHIQAPVGHTAHCLQQGPENQGEPHEEEQGKHGDASSPVLHRCLLMSGRLRVFLQKGGRSGRGRRRLEGRQVGLKSWGQVVSLGDVWWSKALGSEGVGSKCQPHVFLAV